MSSKQTRSHLLIELRHLQALRKLRRNQHGRLDNMVQNLNHMISNRMMRLANQGI